MKSARDTLETKLEICEGRLRDQNIQIQRLEDQIRSNKECFTLHSNLYSGSIWSILYKIDQTLQIPLFDYADYPMVTAIFLYHEPSLTPLNDIV